MDIYVLRHAIAVPHGAAGYERDSDRPLTAKGAKKMKRIARGMSTLGLSFDLILSSPFPRAQQTAEIVAEEFGMKKRMLLTPCLAVGGDPEELIREVTGSHGSVDKLMIVGHEPYLSRLVSMLVSGQTDLEVTMKKGGLCKLTVEDLRYGRCATLEWLLTPRVMEGIR